MPEGPTIRIDAGGATVVLVPAAESEFGAEGRIEGTLDVPLTERGRAEARRILEERLRGLGEPRIYAAPNRSSRETAEILASADSVRVRLVPGLAGISCGSWEGLPVSELRQRHRRSFERWVDDPFCLTPPGGEECAQAEARICSALKSILKKNRTGFVVVVAPAPVIEVGYRHLNGW